MAQSVSRRSASRRPLRGGTRRPGTRGQKSGIERFRRLLEHGYPGAHSYVVLLGIDARDASAVMQLIDAGLSYSAFERLLANTSLTAEALRALVNLPQRTLTRRKREGRFRPDESDRLVRAARVFARALALFDGDREAARRWLSEPQNALGGETPLSVARTEVGALEVERLIGRLEHGVFS